MTEPGLSGVDHFRPGDVLQIPFAKTPLNRRGQKLGDGGLLCRRRHPAVVATECRRKLFARHEVVRGDGRYTAVQQKLDHGRAFGAGEPDDVNAPAAEAREDVFPHEPNPTPSAASNAPKIQNRTTVCVSVQPLSSK